DSRALYEQRGYRPLDPGAAGHPARPRQHPAPRLRCHDQGPGIPQRDRTIGTGIPAWQRRGVAEADRGGGQRAARDRRAHRGDPARKVKPMTVGLELATIPVIDARAGGTVRYALDGGKRARSLRDDCISWLPRGAASTLPVTDAVTRAWLRRSPTPYLKEIEA